MTNHTVYRTQNHISKECTAYNGQPQIPHGVPQSVEMAIADIEEGEKEFERNDTFTHQEIMQMVWNKIGCYAD